LKTVLLKLIPRQEMIYEIALNNKFIINTLKWKEVNEIHEENTPRLKLEMIIRPL